jgi:alpha-ketoglutarate-dependent taurine dioxygenase
MPVIATPLTPHVGAEVTGLSGVDFVNPRVADHVRAALVQYGVVVYRAASLSDDELIALSRLLGEVVVQPTGEHRHPEIQTITLDPTKTDERIASYRQGNFHWHIDGATQGIPQQATLLSAQEVDGGGGGDTEFASTYAAYDALSDPDKAEIADLRVVHSFAAAQQLANPDPSEAERASWDLVPTRVHPLVWTQHDGRKSLLLGATAAEVIGWSTEKSRAFLDRLLAWSTQAQFVLRHHWQRGDLVIWDNTGMLHRALPFEPASRRLLHRTTLAGAEAVA